MVFSVPTPIKELEAFPVNNLDPAENGVIIARWNPPGHSHGNLTGYTVEACPVEEDDRMNRAQCVKM